MTVASTTNRVDYTGNGSVDTYSYTFRIFAETDLLVTVRDTDDLETTLTLSTHYTVTDVGSLSGGTIALVNGAFDWIDGSGDLETGYHLTIRRVRPITQTTDIRNQGDFYPEGHEDEFDRQVMIDQQQQDEIDRSIRLPESVSSAVFDPTLPSDLIAGKAIIVNAAGDGLDLSTVDASTFSPLTTKGDIATYSTVAARLPVGTNDQFLVSDSAELTGLKWKTTLPVANGGTGATTLTANSLVVGNGTSAVALLAPSTSGNVVTSNGTSWVSSAPGLPAVSSKTANYTLVATDGLIIGNTAGGAFTLTLPTAVGNTGVEFRISKGDTSANLLSIATTSSQTISGLASTKLHRIGELLRVISDGANWVILSPIERIERALVTSTGTITSQSGNWITAGTWSPTGTLNVPIVSGIFSSTPVVVVAGANGNNIANVGTAATTTTNIRIESTSDSAAPTDQAMQIIAMGPR